MRVTHVMASAAAGGGATYLKWLLPGLFDRNVCSSLVTGTDGQLGSDLSEQGFQVHNVNLMRSRFSPVLAYTLRRHVISSRPDIVHAHGTRAAFYCSLAGLHQRFPSVYTAHGLAFRNTQGFLRRGVMKGAEWLALRKLAGLASVSRSDLKALEGLRRMRQTQRKYIPNPVDTRVFKPGDAHQARLRLGLPADAFVVGTVSRLVEQKGLDVLIRAAAQCPDATFVIVGDGPLDGSLKRLTAELGANCLFLGERQDVPEILPAFSVFALSSRWEGEPLSLLEAMATGLPCVASETPGSRDILDNGQAGKLFKIEDHRALADIIRAYRSSAELLSQMSKAALTAAQARTVARMVEDTLDIYTACLS